MTVLRTEFHKVACDSGLAAVVRLDGVLSIQTAPVVRDALLKAVAGQPVVVVADVATLSVPDDVVLALFPAIARHAAAWPGISLVLAQPNPALAAALARTAVVRYVPVVNSVRTACASVDSAPPRRFTENMPAGPGAVLAARALVRAGCEQWKIPEVLDTAELIVSELASNAVRHAGGFLEIGVALRRRYLHLSVRDCSDAPPRVGRGEGRGLLLVEAFTVAWGCTALGDGKVVWATLRLP